MSDRERDAFDLRPTAEEMLARVRSEPGMGRGRLRVYLGMAPGVGKTYRMLEEAHRRADRGTDLVVGFVEAHGRPRTIDLLDGLEIVPRRRIEYRGVIIEEMDTDAVLARHPTVALVDELAHTNVPGSEREKRWQDVELIRDAGIHVISTCNVQHLESVADAVASITGAPVNERLPDEVLAAADEIELVDMSPHALRQRMRHGNVYPPERASVALDRFFTEPNLTALRELALRFVARGVEGQIEELAAQRGLGGTPVADRVMVVIDGGPADPRAVRRAAALAAALRARLIALDLASPDHGSESWDRARDRREALDDVIDLGAEVVTVDSSDDAAAIADAALGHRVTHVVLPYRPASTMERLRARPRVERILDRAPGLEIHLVAATQRPGPNAALD